MRLITALISNFALIALFATAAHSQIKSDSTSENWKICNQTSYVLQVANAYMRGGRVQASGWQNMNPGVCLSETPPADSPRFLYAQSAPIHQGDIRDWSGNIELCVDDADFLIPATNDCRAEGFIPRRYLAVNPAESQTDLIEPAEFGENAKIAGLQRLLKDAGYKISRIDGVAGRRTQRTITAFKKDEYLDKNLSDEALFNALIESAKIHKVSVGLEICNEGTKRIWSAIATRHQGGWQSRGWWDIEPNSCTKPYNASLQGTEAHIFALQENADAAGKTLPDRHLRTISAVPSQFCIGEAKFAATGREFCAENGYNIVNFRPVSTENDGTKVSLTDADFFDLNNTGLRR
ncbi:MAG: DUF1036 domain-containing protein [Litorimonas sp.]